MSLYKVFTALALLAGVHGLGIDRRATTPSPTTAPSCGPTAPSFNCDPNGYIVQANALYNYSLTTSTFSLIKNNVAPGSAQLQAIGFNPIDHYIYGYRNDAGGQGVFRISADGTYTQVNNDTSPDSRGSTFTGDVDGNGHLWLYTSANLYYQYDVTRNSPTYGQLISSGSTNGGSSGLYVYDWVSFPSAGPYFYSVATVNGRVGMYRFNTNTTSWSYVQAYFNISGTFGAQFGVNNGTLLAQENNSGALWNFPIDGSLPFITAHGPASSYNDGARCFLSPTIR